MEPSSAQRPSLAAPAQPPGNSKVSSSIAAELAKEVAAEIGAAGTDVDEGIAKVSLVGAGMKTESGVAAKMFRLLSDHAINIEMISTSPIRISCVVRGEDIDAAVRYLHDGFGLAESEDQG